MQIAGTPDRPGRWEMIDTKLTGYTWIFLVFMAGWLCSTGYYGVTGLWAQAAALHRVQTVVVPKLASENWHLQHIVKNQAPDVAMPSKKCDP